MKKKLLTLMTLLVAVYSGAWAETETPGNTGTDKTNLVGKSYSIDGTYIAGKGSSQLTPMESKGVKVRLNQSSNTLVIKVSAGYEINALTIYGYANDKSKTNSVTSVKVDGTDKQASAVTLPSSTASEAATVSVSGIAATDNITLTFGGGATQGIFDFHFTYTKVADVSQEINAVTINGSDISAADLATLKSTKAVEIDGSSLNGIGMIKVGLSTGSTVVNRVNSGDDVVYTFTINETDEYTVTVTNVAKTYTLEGLPVYYKKGETEATGTNTESLSANGITFTYPSKTFQYGSGSVTISGDVYQPIKLSTGEAVTVTFPTGKKATKIIVYGWSVDGTGYMKTFKDASDGENSISTSSNIFYATNNAIDIYPSVYEYPVDNWEGLYFECTGGQPFIVVDFVFAQETVAITPSYERTTYVTTTALDFSDVDGGLKAYVATEASNGKVTLDEVGAVPVGTPLLLIGTAETKYNVPVAAAASAPAKNMLKAGDGTTTFDGKTYDYILYTDGLFYQIGSGTVATNKAYLHCDTDPTATSGDAPGLALSFGDDTTGIRSIGQFDHLQSDNWYDLQGRQIVKSSNRPMTPGLYIVNGKKVVIK